MKIRAAILVMKEWRDRAFLRAQMIEEGIRTLAVETVDEADKWISDGSVVPTIIIYDNRLQENPSRDIECLGKYTSSIPVLIIAGNDEEAEVFRRSGFENIIRRPATIGDVVKRAKEILRRDLI